MNDSSHFYNIEVFPACTWGPRTLTLGVAAEDDRGNMKIDPDTGKPFIETPYDFSGYTIEAPIIPLNTSITGSYSLTVETANLSAGEITISIDDDVTEAMHAWKQTTKPTEVVAEYRLKWLGLTEEKVKLYGKIAVNSIGYRG